MSAQFSKQVELGLKLSKRIFYGRSGSMSAPDQLVMEDSSLEMVMPNLPTAPMAYAVIKDPAVVDNPDIPSYQPHVHGPCLPPALIPLHMHGIKMEVDCYLDTAFVTVSGTWRVHCVTSNKTSPCLIAIPFGDQGSVLGVEIDTGKRSYYTQLIAEEDGKNAEEASKCSDGWLLKGQTYTLTVPKVDGGSYLSVKIRWSKKLVYQDGEFGLTVPYSFPAYVVPVARKVVIREKILLNVNAGTGTEVLCKTTSHPLKQLRRGVGQLGFVYDEEVLRWSTTDFTFSYSVESSNIFGGLVLHSPSQNDFDQREMFNFYLYPGNNRMKVFRKEVTFIIDISASMQGRPIQNIKDAVTSALLKLNQTDSFNILVFNEGTQFFSSSMELATGGMIGKATKWIDSYFVADGGTNMLIPLTKALDMVAKTTDAIPIFFLVTDGAVKDEIEICNVMKSRLGSRIDSPRICTFGIGSYCNHYFLQILAQIGRGHYDAAYDVGSINVRMKSLVQNASSLILANIRIDALEHVDSLELYPFQLQDLSSGRPLIASGRYRGKFPESVKVTGTLADFNTFHVDIKIQSAKSFPIDTVFAKSEIETLTAQAWLLGSKQLEEKVAKLSIQTGFPSEYTRFVFVRKTDKVDFESDLDKMKVDEVNGNKMILLRHVGLGFGNLTATVENLCPADEDEEKQAAVGLIMSAASNYCSKMLNMCCCMCFIRSCSQLNDQCSIAITQLCSALACFACINCCIEFCSSCD